VNHDANITAVLGATGSGKSAWLKQKLRRDRPRRLMIWDPKHEYTVQGVMQSTAASLVAYVSQFQRHRPFGVTFTPSTDAKIRAQQFEIFCRLALGDHNKP
jgi:ABC-type cobalamin/Fe3+-siderophores transport system ATPase subunit